MNLTADADKIRARARNRTRNRQYPILFQHARQFEGYHRSQPKFAVDCQAVFIAVCQLNPFIRVK